MSSGFHLSTSSHRPAMYGYNCSGYRIYGTHYTETSGVGNLIARRSDTYIHWRLKDQSVRFMAQRLRKFRFQQFSSTHDIPELLVTHTEGLALFIYQAAIHSLVPSFCTYEMQISYISFLEIGNIATNNIRRSRKFTFSYLRLALWCNSIDQGKTVAPWNLRSWIWWCRRPDIEAHLHRSHCQSPFPAKRRIHSITARNKLSIDYSRHQSMCRRDVRWCYCAAGNEFPPLGRLNYHDRKNTLRPPSVWASCSVFRPLSMTLDKASGAIIEYLSCPSKPVDSPGTHCCSICTFSAQSIVDYRVAAVGQITYMRQIIFTHEIGLTTYLIRDQQNTRHPGHESCI